MLKIKKNELMSRHTSFRVGGPAKYFTVVKDPAEVGAALDFAKEKLIAWKIIGDGSNILVSDDGYDGLIIKLSGAEISFDGDVMECFAGIPLARAISESIKRGLLGLEWGIGIPGTIGGAMHNNAGAYGGEMSQSVVSAAVLCGDAVKTLANSECGFGYRTSRFKHEGNDDVILTLKLKLNSAPADEVAAAKQKMAKVLAERHAKFSGFSAGSVFMNIMLDSKEMAEFKKKYPELPDQYAGYGKIPAAWLIERCELKGREIGGAKISEGHAGIIYNANKATAKDIIMLISIIKQKVRMRYNLQLMEEIEYVGF